MPHLPGHLINYCLQHQKQVLKAMADTNLLKLKDDELAKRRKGMF